MIFHIGKRVTLRTLCGKPVARRWWVDAAERNTGPTVVTMRLGERLAVHVGLYDVTCKECLKMTAPTEAQKERRGTEG